MLNINDTTATIFVKGFAQDVHYDVLMSPSDCQGEFFAIITDLVTSGHVKITSATKNDEGKWILECIDGETRILEQEPDTPRELKTGKLVTNYVRGFMQDRYDVIFPEKYAEAAEAIANGDHSYRLVGSNGREGHEGRTVATSSLVKFWKDPNGKHHGMTMSGSHYIF